MMKNAAIASMTVKLILIGNSQPGDRLDDSWLEWFT
jgi:hypothetical protein